jgi:type III secretory pathway component EscS
MTKIRLILSIDCENEQMATRVQDQYLPNLNELLQVDGIFAVKAEWLAERDG